MPDGITFTNEHTTKWAAFQPSSNRASFMGNPWQSRNSTVARTTGGYMPNIVWLFAGMTMRATWEVFDFDGSVMGSWDELIAGDYTPLGEMVGESGNLRPHPLDGDQLWQDDTDYWLEGLRRHELAADRGDYFRTSPPRNIPKWRNSAIRFHGTFWAPRRVNYIYENGVYYSLADTHWARWSIRSWPSGIKPRDTNLPFQVSGLSVALEELETYIPEVYGAEPWPADPLPRVGVSSFSIWQKIMSLAGGDPFFQLYYQEPLDRNFRFSAERWSDTLASELLFRHESLPGIGLDGSVWANSADRIEQRVPDWNGTRGGVVAGNSRWLFQLATTIHGRIP